MKNKTNYTKIKTPTQTKQKTKPKQQNKNNKKEKNSNFNPSIINMGQTYWQSLKKLINRDSQNLFSSVTEFKITSSDNKVPLNKAAV